MYIYSSDQIKKVDQAAEQNGMPPFTLMEIAGNGLFRQIAPLLSKKDRIMIIAGKGNNGGDAIVLSRYLKNHGFNTELVMPLGTPKTGAAKLHLAYYKSCGYIEQDFNRAKQYDWIIDGILGVGTALPLREDVKDVTKWIKMQDAKIISIDIPTGVSSDSGKVDAYALKANYTFSLHGYKPSAFLFPAADYYGDRAVVDIGIIHDSGWKVWSEADVRESMPKRGKNTHKGTFGTGLLVAGSDEMPGSAALAAIGAVRFGTGKLAITTTKHASTIIGPLVPEATYLFNRNAWSLLSDYSCIAIGPGLTPNIELEQDIKKVLAEDIPVILDAGALSKREYGKRTKPVIITPHLGELSRLTGLSTIEIQENRIMLAAEYAKNNGIIVVLKGHYTVIAFPDGTGIVNLTGNASLAKGGTGDTLTGMILASIGTQPDIKTAVANAVYIHGACADQWTADRGERSLAAHDFGELLSKVCYRFEVLTGEKDFKEYFYT